MTPPRPRFTDALAERLTRGDTSLEPTSAFQKHAITEESHAIEEKDQFHSVLRMKAGEICGLINKDFPSLLPSNFKSLINMVEESGYGIDPVET